MWLFFSLFLAAVVQITLAIIPWSSRKVTNFWGEINGNDSPLCFIWSNLPICCCIFLLSIYKYTMDACPVNAVFQTLSSLHIAVQFWNSQLSICAIQCLATYICRTNHRSLQILTIVSKKMDIIYVFQCVYLARNRWIIVNQISKLYILYMCKSYKYKRNTNTHTHNPCIYTTIYIAYHGVLVQTYLF